MRKPLSATPEIVNGIVSGILAYRCENGHVFMVLAEENTFGKGAGG